MHQIRFSHLFGAIVVITNLATACAGSPSDDGGNDDASEDGGTQADGGDPDPSWDRGFTEDAIAISCSMTREDLESSGAAAVHIGDASIYAGYEQVSGNNQDPVLVRIDGDSQSWCQHHEETPPDGRALGLTWDGGERLYAVYTVDGGGSGFDAHVDGWLASYGMGGGPKVSVLLAVDAGTGIPAHGTYVTARLSDGKTNTHRPREAPLVETTGTVAFRGSSAFRPLNPDTSTMMCSDYPFDSFARFDADLASMICAQTSNCEATTPCAQDLP